MANSNICLCLKPGAQDRRPDDDDDDDDDEGYDDDDDEDDDDDDDNDDDDDEDDDDCLWLKSRFPAVRTKLHLQISKQCSTLVCCLCLLNKAQTIRPCVTSVLRLYIFVGDFLRTFRNTSAIERRM